MADISKWYVVHTYSGYENKVASNIETVVENRKIHDQILEVKVPTETVQMNDDTWYVIRNTRGVTGFVGPEGKPVPLTDDEIYALGVEKKVVEVNYKKGDMVSIIDGAFEGVIGVVDNVDTDNNSVRVVISMLGRETPVDLELDQVEAINN